MAALHDGRLEHGRDFSSVPMLAEQPRIPPGLLSPLEDPLAAQLEWRETVLAGGG
jgi:hypothetical protein